MAHPSLTSATCVPVTTSPSSPRSTGGAIIGICSKSQASTNHLLSLFWPFLQAWISNSLKLVPIWRNMHLLALCILFTYSDRICCTLDSQLLTYLSRVSGTRHSHPYAQIFTTRLFRASDNPHTYPSPVGLQSSWQGSGCMVISHVAPRPVYDLSIHLSARKSALP